MSHLPAEWKLAIDLQYAIQRMAERLADATEEATRALWFNDDDARQKARRAAKRRRAALARLTLAMRNLITRED